MPLLHEEITKEIIGAAFEVHRILLNELKATGIKVGLLINFGRTKVEYKRMVF
jgi:hypothetical protein